MKKICDQAAMLKLEKGITGRDSSALRRHAHAARPPMKTNNREAESVMSWWYEMMKTRFMIDKIQLKVREVFFVFYLVIKWTSSLNAQWK